jgi:hypothetical protein
VLYIKRPGRLNGHGYEGVAPMSWPRAELCGRPGIDTHSMFLALCHRGLPATSKVCRFVAYWPCTTSLMRKVKPGSPLLLAVFSITSSLWRFFWVKTQDVSYRLNKQQRKCYRCFACLCSTGWLQSNGIETHASPPEC